MDLECHFIKMAGLFHGMKIGISLKQ